MTQRHINLHAMIRIVRFRVRDVGDLLVMREEESNDQFREIIDEDYVIDLWADLLTMKCIEKAFETGDAYLVDRVFAAYKHLQKTRNTTMACDVNEYFKHPKHLLTNPYPVIDNLIVHYGLIDLEVKANGNREYTPLSHACYKLNYERAAFLLKHTTKTDGEFMLLLSWAGSLDCGELKNPKMRKLVKLFIESGISDQEIVDGLYEVTDDLPFFKFVIELTSSRQRPFDFNTISEEATRTLLMGFVNDGDLELLKYLLDNGADVNLITDDRDVKGNINKETALSIMLKQSLRLDAISLFIDYGLVFNLKDDNGRNRLKNHIRLVDILGRTLGYSKNKARVTTSLKQSDLVHVHKITRAMLEEDAKQLMESDYLFRTPYMMAPDLTTLRILLEYTKPKYLPRLSNPDSKMNTVMSYLYERKQVDCIKHLLSLNTRVGVSKVFFIIKRDAEDYRDVQRQVDELVEPRVPDGALSSFVPLPKLLEYYNDKMIPFDLFEYILETKNELEVDALYNALRGNVSSDDRTREWKALDILLKRSIKHS